MMQLKGFFNEGHGWVCRQCDKQLNNETSEESKMSRFYREGESETKSVNLSNRALAKWTDKTRRFLTCRRCGIVEPIDIS